jgi:4-aminobutyrate aminotransferase-like enzyme
LDAFAGIVTVSVGHGHPAVVDAVVKQTRLLQHTTTIYLHHAIADYAEALAQRMPGNLKVQIRCYMIFFLVDLKLCLVTRMVELEWSRLCTL